MSVQETEISDPAFLMCWFCEAAKIFTVHDGRLQCSSCAQKYSEANVYSLLTALKEIRTFNL